MAAVPRFNVCNVQKVSRFWGGGAYGRVCAPGQCIWGDIGLPCNVDRDEIKREELHPLVANPRIADPVESLGGEYWQQGLVVNRQEKLEA